MSLKKQMLTVRNEQKKRVIFSQWKNRMEYRLAKREINRVNEKFNKLYSIIQSLCASKRANSDKIFMDTHTIHGEW